MSDLDTMILAISKTPDDIAARGALADMLDEHGEEELATMMRGADGWSRIIHAGIIAETTGCPICVRCLWAASKNLVRSLYTVVAQHPLPSRVAYGPPGSRLMSVDTVGHIPVGSNVTATADGKIREAVSNDLVCGILAGNAGPGKATVWMFG